jgi:hypothetical protein
MSNKEFNLKIILPVPKKHFLSNMPASNCRVLQNLQKEDVIQIQIE